MTGKPSQAWGVKRHEYARTQNRQWGANHHAVGKANQGVSDFNQRMTIFGGRVTLVALPW